MRQLNLCTPVQDAADYTRTLNYIAAQIAQNGGTWVPACGGTEQPFTARNGRRVLYCFNHQQRRHAYIDLSTDIEMSDDECRAAGLLS